MGIQKCDPVDYLISEFGLDKHYRFMPNGGNLGDNLIAAAIIQKFEKKKLSWSLFTGGSPSMSDKDILIYGGGGSLVPLYQGGVDCINYLKRFNRPIVVFPQTVRGHSAFWESSKGINIFCRDIESYRYISSYSSNKAFLADDMAINLDIDEYPYSGVIDYHKKIKAISSPGSISRELNVFRRDEESFNKNSLINSVDVPVIQYPKFTSAGDIKTQAMFFLMSFAPFDQLNTDRLHSCIAAAKIGLNVNFYDNSYGKNLAVYEFSLKERFDNVSLITQTLK